MSRLKIEKLVEEMLQPILEKLRFELVDIEYKKEGGNWYLRIYIDKPGGITIDDCQTVSEQIGDLLIKKIRYHIRIILRFLHPVSIVF